MATHTVTTMATTTASKADNPMRSIAVAKVTLNVGAGKNEDLLKKGLLLLAKISSPLQPVKTVTTKRVPAWGLRPGLAIGGKVTIRHNAGQLLKRLLAAKHHTLSAGNFDRNGNLSFGIPEYIDIPGLAYDPELKILGLDVAVTLGRPGFRVQRRQICPAKIGKKHRIVKSDAIAFIRSLGVEVTE